MHTFNSLSLAEPLLRAVAEEGYTTPTPVQTSAIPLILEGRDVLGSARTGTGKTAAFAIPMLQLLERQANPGRKRPIRALVLTPTRELAIQIDESFKAYGRYTRVECQVIFGGVNQHSQVINLQKGTDVLVATPGRLLDLMGQGIIHLKTIEIFVLDEADRMLDMGFIHDVKRVIAALPGQRQSLFFSATLPPEIIKLSQSILQNPARVEVHPGMSTVELVNQSLYYVDKGNKNSLLLDLLAGSKLESVLVFTRTKHGADKVAKQLIRHGVTAEAIHGNKSQNARQRALSNFKDRTTRVLVATDIAARGIDVENMEWVINFEIPNIPETYVHRIGRTARAGAAGSAMSFCEAEEIPYIRDIEKSIGQKIPVVTDHPYPMASPPQSASVPKEPSRDRHPGKPGPSGSPKKGRRHFRPRAE